MSLLKSASIVSLLTLASRITGLVRELLIAAAFGASATTDAFQVAFRIPNLLRRLFAEGAFSQAFVPILAESRARQGDEATHKLIDAVGSVLFWVLLVVSIVGVVAAPVLVWLMASGLKESGGFDAAVVMTRWMFPYIFCMSLVALSAGILNTWGHFAMPAATPVVLNLCVIGAALGLAPVFQAHGHDPVLSLAVGVMVGGVLQLGIQIPALARRGVVPRLALTWGALKAAWAHDGVHRILRQMAPALLGVSVAQVSLLINTQIASHLGAGAVSWLTYADRLMEFPTAMLGVALGVVLLPQLSKAQASGDQARFSSLLDWGLRLVLLLALPCAVALLVFATPLVSVLYHYGQFGHKDVEQTVLALMGYGVGLMGLIGVKILAPGFYATQDIRTPVRIGIGVLVLTQILNVVFVPYLAQAGLALSIGLASLVNAGMLLWGLRRAGRYQPEAGWWLYAGRVILATALLGVGLWLAAHHIDWVGLRAQPMVRIGALTLCLLGAAVVYFGTLMATGLNLRQTLRR
ncbi:MAG TPA: murein biosynthesis integral membrane protein MurJ [Aquabacterium sp.]|uniref:murein biosynthesis integral membrane protein MurJ n=1 Tax=Aquabacterium sp. TaxID=1872578 RepID=UPI002E2EF8A9|nr:murein biosynthesis integral membrane protein MurJ [Aquabacterium sp.]HEX5371400.1 murein biosynthesis integral membrane protein MurJ [Aquabacterium sp.]